MNRIDLNELQARHEAATRDIFHLAQTAGSGSPSDTVRAFLHEDVPALIARIRELEAGGGQTVVFGFHRH